MSAIPNLSYLIPRSNLLLQSHRVGLIGIALIFADISLYLAYFFVGLGVIDALNEVSQGMVVDASNDE